MFRGLLLSAALLCAVPVVAGQAVQDPMRPPGAASVEAAQGARGVAGTAGAWTLTSTRVAAGQRVAVINGRVVGVGERVGGAKVIAIEPGAVRLRSGGGEFTVRLVRTAVKRETR